MRRALVVCLLATCASTGDGIDWSPADVGCDFLRVRDGVIETAVLRMRAPSGAIVDLAGVYHVGHAEYYGALERHLPGAEVVISESKMSFVDETTPKGDIDPDLELIHRYQIAVARSLGLTLQRDWEREVADGRWMPLDLPLKRQAEAGPLLSDEGRAGLLAAARDPPPPSEAQRRRDDAIREGLARVLKHARPRRVVLLFGPAHLRALVPTLGYRSESVVWYPVMRP